MIISQSWWQLCFALKEQDNQGLSLCLFIFKKLLNPCWCEGNVYRIGSSTGWWASISVERSDKIEECNIPTCPQTLGITTSLASLRWVISFWLSSGYLGSSSADSSDGIIGETHRKVQVSFAWHDQPFRLYRLQRFLQVAVVSDKWNVTGLPGVQQGKHIIRVPECDITSFPSLPEPGV